MNMVGDFVVGTILSERITIGLKFEYIIQNVVNKRVSQYQQYIEAIKRQSELKREKQERPDERKGNEHEKVKFEA